MFNVLQNAMMAVAQAAPAAESAPGSAPAAAPGVAPDPALAAPPPALAPLQQSADTLNAAAQNAPPDMGFLHFVAQTDFVGKTLFIILILMSLVTWYLIVVKVVSNLRMRKRSGVFLNHFWNASSLQQVENEIVTHGAQDPFSHLTSHAIHAQSHHAKFGATKLEEAGSNSEFVTRTMRKVIDEETAKLENGLTVLASVGSTAPFVGLFGTVWGVYHALVGIGLSDGVTINRIAGPVGEALIMTGLGLAVAIPAVLAYNMFVRNNRVYLSRLDAFAHDLFAFLTTGQQVEVSDGKVRALGRQRHARGGE
ncbi:MotA/TolQ/ExbB proton channel family protein [Bordetella trematum]|uniref:MotA/TolQ/ExbB proton channel family protein n=1 Tax=Bordetella trematum TaxID=123899 RepID=UPI001559908D|nr:MotA/TolQ/ExbB proton channel family protein [Bordetella trematum]